MMHSWHLRRSADLWNEDLLVDQVAQSQGFSRADGHGQPKTQRRYVRVSAAAEVAKLAHCPVF